MRRGVKQKFTENFFHIKDLGSSVSENILRLERWNQTDDLLKNTVSVTPVSVILELDHRACALIKVLYVLERDLRKC